VFDRTHGIAHSDFFRTRAATDRILAWLAL
jgi:hypothetical protein